MASKGLTDKSFVSVASKGFTGTGGGLRRGGGDSSALPQGKESEVVHRGAVIGNLLERILS